MPHQMTVLFLCADNADRGPMAAAMLNHEDGIDMRGISAGLRAADAIVPEVGEALREIGVSLEVVRPEAVTPELARRADRVIALGSDVVADCPDDIPVHEAWPIPPMQGRPLEDVRAVRDQLRQKVRQLMRTA